MKCQIADRLESSIDYDIQSTREAAQLGNKIMETAPESHIYTAVKAQINKRRNTLNQARQTLKQHRETCDKCNKIKLGV